MLQNLFSTRQLRLSKWSSLVHSTPYAPYVQQSHDSILELRRTSQNDVPTLLNMFKGLHNMHVE